MHLEKFDGSDLLSLLSRLDFGSAEQWRWKGLRPGVRPVFFGPCIRISCTGRHQHPRVRLSLRKVA